MNAILIKLLLFFVPFIGLSQLKDAYFLLDESNQDYVISTSIGEFSEANSNKIAYFFLSQRDEYEKVQKEIRIMKERGTFIDHPELYNGPHLFWLQFKVWSIKAKTIPEIELKQMKFVDFNWLNKNSWKPNNKNIVFNDLYFLYKIQDDKYLIYKVGRTQVVQ